jgi:hypothetical protein
VPSAEYRGKILTGLAHRVSEAGHLYEGTESRRRVIHWQPVPSLQPGRGILGFLGFFRDPRVFGDPRVFSQGFLGILGLFPRVF